MDDAIQKLLDATKQVALSSARLLLRARLAEIEETEDELGKATIIRRYQLGPTTLVKDKRSGKQTGRLDRVLEGDLDMFFQTSAPDGAGREVRSRSSRHRLVPLAEGRLRMERE